MKTVWSWPLNHWLAIVLPSIERLQLNSRGHFSPDSDTSRGIYVLQILPSVERIHGQWDMRVGQECDAIGGNARGNISDHREGTGGLDSHCRGERRASSRRIDEVGACNHGRSLKSHCQRPYAAINALVLAKDTGACYG